MKSHFPTSSRPTEPTSGFSLLEILVAMAVLALMLAILFSITSEGMRTWQGAEAQRARQQTARIVFELVARDLESMLLPHDPADSTGFQFVINPNGIEPALRNADAAFWQALQGTRGAMGDVAQVGYFVRWTIVNGESRAVLCRYLDPPENVASRYSGGAIEWINTGEVLDKTAGDAANELRGLIAENVIGWWITPLASDGTELPKPFDSRDGFEGLAAVEVTIVVIDPRTALRIESSGSVTAAYAAGPDGFLEALPESVKVGARMFQTRVPIPTRL
jgi:prepilin-type N-terminal cleavage/methylation domain-containing protein